MMIHKLIFSTACAVFSLLLAWGAHAADYQDWWWNPNESGHGLNIGQQGNILFAAWFTYDEGGNGMWLIMAGQLSGNTVAGDLIHTTGPQLGKTFDPNAVVGTVVGQATLTFTDLHHASFNYTVNGISGSVQLQRFSFAPIPIEGVYMGIFLFNRTGCSFVADGLQTDVSAYRISTENPNLTITAVSLQDPNAQCTYSGTYQQYGSKLTASGSFSCTSGTRGTWFSDDLIFNDHGFMGTASLQATIGETCRSVGDISATKY